VGGMRETLAGVTITTSTAGDAVDGYPLPDDCARIHVAYGSGSERCTAAEVVLADEPDWIAHATRTLLQQVAEKAVLPAPASLVVRNGRVVHSMDLGQMSWVLASGGTEAECAVAHAVLDAQARAFIASGV
jgi:hypothetical protein